MLHYYLFSFATNNGFARVTMGFMDDKISETRIREARKAALADEVLDAVPLAVSYLGYMLPSEAVA